MEATTFVVGDFVRNFPAGKEGGIVVEGVVTEVISDGSPVIAANFRGDYVRFVADAAKTEKRA